MSQKTKQQIATENDAFRKSPGDASLGSTLARIMYPRDVDTFSIRFDLVDRAMSAIKEYDFPLEDASSRNQGVVNVDDVEFRWAIGYQAPADHEDIRTLCSETHTLRVLTVYVP